MCALCIMCIEYILCKIGTFSWVVNNFVNLAKIFIIHHPVVVGHLVFIPKLLKTFFSSTLYLDQNIFPVHRLPDPEFLEKNKFPEKNIYSVNEENIFSVTFYTPFCY